MKGENEHGLIYWWRGVRPTCIRKQQVGFVATEMNVCCNRKSRTSSHCCTLKETSPQLQRFPSCLSNIRVNLLFFTILRRISTLRMNAWHVKRYSSSFTLPDWLTQATSSVKSVTPMNWFRRSVWFSFRSARPTKHTSWLTSERPACL